MVRIFNYRNQELKVGSKVLVGYHPWYGSSSILMGTGTILRFTLKQALVSLDNTFHSMWKRHNDIIVIKEANK